MYTRDNWLELADPAGYWTSGTGCLQFRLTIAQKWLYLKPTMQPDLLPNYLAYSKKKMAEKYSATQQQRLGAAELGEAIAEITLDSGKARVRHSQLAAYAGGVRSAL